MPNISRQKLKLDAKASLKGNWGRAIGISLTYIVISLILSGVVSIATPTKYNQSLSTTLLLILINILITALLAPLDIGIISFFLKLSNNQSVKVSELFSKFNIFLKTVGLIFLTSIKIFLWSLLFIVPGIIASLNYSQAYFIMAQNSDVGIVEAIELSKQMMKGEKGKLFVLGLSFIGWIILAALTLGILLIYVYPYMTTTLANFYNTVSKKVNIPSQNTDPMHEFY